MTEKSYNDINDILSYHSQYLPVKIWFSYQTTLLPRPQNSLNLSICICWEEKENIFDLNIQKHLLEKLWTVETLFFLEPLHSFS